MLRRAFTFLTVVTLVVAAGLLVYLNPDESSLRLTRAYDLELPLGVLIVAAALAGGVLVFIANLAREGQRALREWRARRHVAAADRTVQMRADGVALTVAGDYRKARTLLAKALRAEEAGPADVIAYAQAFSADGEHGSARRILEKGLEDFGNDASLLLALGSTCRASGDPPSAATALERALSLHPSSPVILASLRDALFDCGNWRRAAEVQERVLGSRPNDERERNRLDGARFEAALVAEPTERHTLLDRILKDSPGFVPAMLAKAELLEAEERSEEAVRMLERGLKRRPDCELLEAMAKLSGPNLRRLERSCRRLLSAADKGPSLEASVERLLAASAAGQTGAGNGTRPLAELPRCSGCRRLAENWAPRCPGCGRWDSLERP